MALLLVACESEEQRTIQLNTSFLSLKPANKYSKSFANASGDTVTVYLSANNRATENVNGLFPIGSFSSTDNIIAETRTYRLDCNNPEIAFTYGFRIIPQSLDDRDYSDLLQISFSDSLGALNDKIELMYRNDSLLLNAPATYNDTLNLISKSYLEVLSPIISDPTESRIFYFSLSQGLVGFQTRAGELFELINWWKKS